jgi:hypothetical protein
LITIRRTGRKRIEEILLEKTACFSDGDETTITGRGIMMYGFSFFVVDGFLFLRGNRDGLLSIDPSGSAHVKRGNPPRSSGTL